MLSARAIELLVLYAAGPMLVAWAVRRYGYRAPIAPLLWLLSAAALQVLSSDPTFNGSVLWSWPNDHGFVTFVALRFVVLGGVLLWLGKRFAPEEFLILARRKSGLWLLLVVLYPTLSALPQGILWRVLFAHRYAPLFATRSLLLVAGALAFSLGHVTYRSVRALAITAIGGAMFLDTYLRSHSMLLAAAEHGVYGVTAFSAGLGGFLGMGRRWRAGELAPAQPKVARQSVADI